LFFEKIPENAVVLFHGKDLSKWKNRKGEIPDWPVENGVATVGKGDILSQELFYDAFIHLEFMEPDMPEATGQHKGNSGVYIQGRYEIQVLDSYGIKVPGKGDCGAIYNHFAPLVNACKPALTWQSYDIIFRAARVSNTGEVTENARLTVLHNEQVIHNNLILNGPTDGAVDHLVGEPGPLLLQDHGNPVKYRNIWLIHLPPEGSDCYESNNDG
jgi:hypothetical protein